MCTRVGITGIDVWAVPFHLCLCLPSLIGAASINLSNDGGWCKSRLVAAGMMLFASPLALQELLNCGATSRPAARPPTVPVPVGGAAENRTWGVGAAVCTPVVVVTAAVPLLPTSGAGGVQLHVITRCCTYLT